MAAGFPSPETPVTPLRFENGELLLLDQRKLPREKVWIACHSPEEVAEAIRNMVVRGAPLLGITAAFGICLLKELHDRARFQSVLELLRRSRPTAVNLFHALFRMERAYEEHREDANLRAFLIREAEALWEEERQASERMGRYGAGLLPGKGLALLTHCNTGALATSGLGTALAVVRTLYNEGRLQRVYATETRPYLQGARLTAWELQEEGIPVTLLCDSAAGWLLARTQVHAVLVGADRIARNGDTANKIGTYTLAVLARRHLIPFYVVAPTTTFDPEIPSGAEIPVEERDPEEVRSLSGIPIAPPEVPALNPAFDITPSELITAFVTEKGVFAPGELPQLWSRS